MKSIMIALVTALTGVVALLAGLGIDAWLHAQDETLAAREGVFTLSNPGHALLGIGLALTCAGVLFSLYFAWGMLRAEGILGRRWVRVISLQASGAATIGAIVFALTVSASGHEHAHGDAASAAGEPHAHDALVATADTSTPMVAEVALVSAQAGAAATHPGVDEAAAMPPPTTNDLPAVDVVAANNAASSSSETLAAAEPEHAHVDAAPSAAAAAGAGASVVDAPIVSDDMRTHPDGMPATTDGAMPAATHDHPEPTAEERACFVALTAEAKVATARFADIEVARAEGYLISDDPTKTHMPNRAYMRDGTSLDLAYPETLVYVLRDGERVFAGALYRALKGQGPTPCGAATYWHAHGRCVPPTGEAIPENKDKTCPAGYEHRDGAVEMMHLWFIPRRGR